MQTRRQFVARAGGAAATVLVPTSLATSLAAAKPFRGGKFPDGVVAGDPTPKGISLWTRFDPSGGGGSGTIELEVARDKGFRHVVARKSINTGAASNHAVKARVAGLKAHEEYYYRFASRGADSAVGRFRTALPADSKAPVKFAFFSCQDYTHGYYNALDAMADGDYDFVVCLGDYIYAEAYHSVKDGTGVRDDKIGRANPANPGIIREAVTLADYRAKYQLYRSDPLLRAMHARFPIVMLWDDHEVQDNYAGKPADGGLDAGKHFSAARKKAGRQAFFENMPAFPGGTKLYRKLSFGANVDLIVTDQRTYRDNQPCDDAVVAPCADYNQPRDLLGRTQMNWVKGALASSKARWKLMANEVTIMPTRVLGGANYTYDTWIGYPQEREELLTHIRDQQIKDVVFLTGDIHTFIAGDVRTGDGATGDTVATELVGGSITSQSLGEIDLDAGGGTTIKGNDANPATAPALIDALRAINPQVDNADFDHHGFGAVTATPSGLTCEMVRMDTIKKKSSKKLPSADWTYHVTPGAPSIKGQHGPA
ncbi:MAG TPA: alkaline phosphatase D family protein [Baekduia sp.]|nr:alkaline phosphatase D family protein [Baekduia sp.]